MSKTTTHPTKGETMNVGGEMPRYRCHKEVHALKIKEVIVQPANGHMIVPEDPHYAAFQISNEFLEKHDPKAGGYFVVYEDGYQSFSPAEAFESGYTLIEV